MSAVHGVKPGQTLKRVPGIAPVPLPTTAIAKATMKSLTLLPALTLLTGLLLTGCAGTDTTGSSRSGAAMGAVGAYSVGALKFREGETGSDGFLVGQHKAEAGRY